ncbi:hypothetical protein D3C72_1984380 [compost metagenome]
MTSPWESVPSVMALTEYSCRLACEPAIDSMALKVASTGPEPCAVALRSWPATLTTICACGTSPVLLATSRLSSLKCSGASALRLSETSACRSSSKISCFLSARSLKRAKAAFSSPSPARTIPSSSSRERNAARPECLPMTILLAFQPTDSADMIS